MKREIRTAVLLAILCGSRAASVGSEHGKRDAQRLYQGFDRLGVTRCDRHGRPGPTNLTRVAHTGTTGAVDAHHSTRRDYTVTFELACSRSSSAPTSFVEAAVPRTVNVALELGALQSITVTAGVD